MWFINLWGFYIFNLCIWQRQIFFFFDFTGMWNRVDYGYHTEYSSMKLGLFLFAEYINMFVSSVVISSFCILEAANLPFSHLWGLTGGWLAAAQFGFFFWRLYFYLLIMWVRWTIPRFSIWSQLLHLGWKILLPLAIFNIIITGLVMGQWSIILNQTTMLTNRAKSVS